MQLGPAQKCKFKYRQVASTNTVCLEAHPGFFRLLMKGKLDAYERDSLGKS